MPDDEDVQAVEDYLTKALGSREEAKKAKHQFILSNPQYVKRDLLTGPQLYLVLKEIEKCFKDCTCPKLQKPLFGPAQWKWWNSLLSLVLDGYVCRVPNVPRYTKTGVCTRTGLDVYRCTRSSSWLENFHLFQRKCNGGNGMGQVLGDLLLHLRVSRWNIDQGVKNCGEVVIGCRSGKRVVQCYDRRLVDFIVQTRAGHVGEGKVRVS